MISAFFARLAAVHPNHKRIASGAFTIGVLTLFTKLVVAAREMAIAWRYGISRTVDAYQLALTATTWAPMMLAGVMSAVLVPRLVKMEQQGRGKREFLGELNAAVILAALLVAGLTFAAAPLAASLMASNKDAGTLQLTSSMTGRMAPIAMVMILSSYLYARLQARQRFSYSATEALPAITIALFVLVFEDPAGTSIVLGSLVGFALQLVVLVGMAMRSDPPLGTVRLTHRSAQWAGLRQSFLLMALGQILITASLPIDQGFASRLGEGSVASLGYANRILTLFSGLGTIVIGRALLPVLSEAVAAGDLTLGRRQALHWTVFLGACATAGSLILWVGAPLLVRTIFERGAFTPSASLEVSALFRIGLLQLPFYFAGIALVQWYAATGRYSFILWVSAAALVLKVILNLILAPLIGLSGIMLGTALMYALTTCLLLIGSNRLLSTPRRGDG